VKIIPNKIIILPMVTILSLLFLFSCSFPDDIKLNDNKTNSSTYNTDVTREVLSADNKPGSLVLQHSSKSDPCKDKAAEIKTIDPGSRLIIILQNINFEDLIEEQFDIAIIDPDDSNLSSQEIKELKGQEKKIISYLSIGEAEEYRSYWQEDWEPGKPEFIDMENPCWPGNYRVNYWHKQWQSIIFEKIEEIVVMGYDGAYLDLVDAYEFYRSQGRGSASYEMIQFIVEISKRAKSMNPSFLIIPQNGEKLIASESYFNAIDGAGRENLWFIDGDRIEHEDNKQSLEHLLKIRQSGKFVFVIEYIDGEIPIGEFELLAEEYCFIPYVGTKNLDVIIDTEK